MLVPGGAFCQGSRALRGGPNGEPRSALLVRAVAKTHAEREPHGSCVGDGASLAVNPKYSRQLGQSESVCVSIERSDMSLNVVKPPMSKPSVWNSGVSDSMLLAMILIGSLAPAFSSRSSTPPHHLAPPHCMPGGLLPKPPIVGMSFGLPSAA